MNTNSTLYITANDIYVEINKDGKCEYLKQAWDQSTWGVSISEVRAGLPSPNVNLVLGSDLPLLPSSDHQMVRTLTESEDNVALVESYRDGFIAAGFTVETIKNLSDLGLGDVATPKEVLQARGVAPTFSPSLEDLENAGAKTIQLSWKIILIVVLIVVAIILAIVFVGGGSSKPKVIPSPSPVASIVLTPAPSVVVASPNNADFTVQVLNGSGTAGLAGKFSAKVEGLGFQVTGTGNADKFDYAKTIIRAGSAVPEGVLTNLKTILPKTVLDETLTSSNSANLVIILGKDAI